MEPLRWEAAEHEHRERSADWYWALGVIAVGGAVAAILLNNVLFGILILVAAFVIALHNRQPPRIMTFEANSRGIIAGPRAYPYDSLEAFWIDDEFGPRDYLILRSSKLVMPYIVLPLEDVDLYDLRDYLLNFLDEEPMQEPFIKKMWDLLGI